MRPDDLVGVVLAGGLGTRLLPLTKDTNKHLLPVVGRPMVEHAIRGLTDAGVCDLVVVTNSDAVGVFERVLGAGRGLGARTIAVVGQPKPAGIADALSRAESRAVGRAVAVMLGDNFFGGGIAGHIRDFADRPTPARLVVWEHPPPSPIPSPFGHAVLDNDGRITRVVEKPERPESPWVVTGLYMYDAGVFERCRGLEPSKRGEVEITDLNDRFVRAGEAACSVHTGWWADAGTMEGLREVERLVAGER